MAADPECILLHLALTCTSAPLCPVFGCQLLHLVSTERPSKRSSVRVGTKAVYGTVLGGGKRGGGGGDLKAGIQVGNGVKAQQLYCLRPGAQLRQPCTQPTVLWAG